MEIQHHELGWREFDCEDCRTHVVRFSAFPEENADVCHGCGVIREQKALGTLTPHEERELRGLLGCELFGGDGERI